MSWMDIVGLVLAVIGFALIIFSAIMIRRAMK